MAYYRAYRRGAPPGDSENLGPTTQMEKLIFLKRTLERFWPRSSERRFGGVLDEVTYARRLGDRASSVDEGGYLRRATGRAAQTRLPTQRCWATGRAESKAYYRGLGLLQRTRPTAEDKAYYRGRGLLQRTRPTTEH